MIERVIVDVDTQRDFMNENGNLYVPNADVIKPILKNIITMVEKDNIPVVKTMDCHLSNDKEFATFPPHCIEGTKGQRSIQETEYDKAIIFNKRCVNVFDKRLGNKDFGKWFTENEVKNVYVCGVVSEICVYHVVMGLVKLVKNVYVFENAIMHLDIENWEKTKKEMMNAGVLFAKAKI